MQQRQKTPVETAQELIAQLTVIQQLTPDIVAQYNRNLTTISSDTAAVESFNKNLKEQITIHQKHLKKTKALDSAAKVYEAYAKYLPPTENKEDFLKKEKTKLSEMKNEDMDSYIHNMKSVLVMTERYEVVSALTTRLLANTKMELSQIDMAALNKVNTENTKTVAPDKLVMALEERTGATYTALHNAFINSAENALKKLHPSDKIQQTKNVQLVKNTFQNALTSEPQALKRFLEETETYVTQLQNPPGAKNNTAIAMVEFQSTASVAAPGTGMFSTGNSTTSTATSNTSHPGSLPQTAPRTGTAPTATSS